MAYILCWVSGITALSSGWREFSKPPSFFRNLIIFHAVAQAFHFLSTILQ